MYGIKYVPVVINIKINILLENSLSCRFGDDHFCLMNNKNKTVTGLNVLSRRLVEAKTLWVLGMPLFLPNCCCCCLVVVVYNHNNGF